MSHKKYKSSFFYILKFYFLYIFIYKKKINFYILNYTRIFKIFTLFIILNFIINFNLFIIKYKLF
jgi:hypothetical protein